MLTLVPSKQLPEPPSCKAKRTLMVSSFHFSRITSQITGGKKQSDEGAALFAVRVHLPCYAILWLHDLGQRPSSASFNWWMSHQR
jgi:hypothetical protein